jgi:hypothetical protein
LPTGRDNRKIVIERILPNPTVRERLRLIGVVEPVGQCRFGLSRLAVLSFLRICKQKEEKHTPES